MLGSRCPSCDMRKRNCFNNKRKINLLTSWQEFRNSTQHSSRSSVGRPHSLRLHIHHLLTRFSQHFSTNSPPEEEWYLNRSNCTTNMRYSMKSSEISLLQSRNVEIHMSCIHKHSNFGQSTASQSNPIHAPLAITISGLTS